MLKHNGHNLSRDINFCTELSSSSTWFYAKTFYTFKHFHWIVAEEDNLRAKLSLAKLCMTLCEKILQGEEAKEGAKGSHLEGRLWENQPNCSSEGDWYENFQSYKGLIFQRENVQFLWPTTMSGGWVVYRKAPHHWTLNCKKKISAEKSARTKVEQSTNFHCRVALENSGGKIEEQQTRKRLSLGHVWRMGFLHSYSRAPPWTPSRSGDGHTNRPILCYLEQVKEDKLVAARKRGISRTNLQQIRVFSSIETTPLKSMSVW